MANNINSFDNDDFSSLDFDEKSEIEKLQETIRSMSANITDDTEGFLSQSPSALMEGGFNSSLFQNEEEFDPYAAIEKPVARNSGPKAKKFVVMVNPENVEFFDKIPSEDRTTLFNKLLTDYKESKNRAKQKKHLIKFSKHMLLGIMVILISLPIMFVVVNKSIELTIKNYKDVQNNFEKLYESRNRGHQSTKRNIY